MPDKPNGTVGVCGIVIVCNSITWPKTPKIPIIQISYWIWSSMNVKDVGIQMEIAAFQGSVICFQLFVNKVMSSHSISNCLIQKKFDMLIWLELTFLPKYSWDGYIAIFVKCPHKVWQVVVFVTSMKMYVWYFPLTILDKGYTAKHTLVTNDLYLHLW